ncbi:hypothetical protein ANTQUA_LOCUS5181 [Anthophora quadrimaculata]
MWFFYIALAVAWSGGVIAFPQNDASDGSVSPQSVFRADGFVFDGPVNDQRDITNAPSSTSGDRISTPGSTSSSSPSSLSSSLPLSSTIPPSNAELDQCVATCPTTPEYNPVCGSDNAIYDNIGKLRCAATCGKDVSLQYYGRCMTTKIRGG